MQVTNPGTRGGCGAPTAGHRKFSRGGLASVGVAAVICRLVAVCLLVAACRLVTVCLLVAACLLVAGCQPEPETAASDQFVTTATGLQYRIRRQGNGAYPREEDLVQLHYRGWLEDGSVFESTFESGEPAALFLKNTIPGWREGLPLCAEGGAIELIIPPELGYGEKGTSGIPGNSTLHFLVEVEKIH